MNISKVVICFCLLLLILAELVNADSHKESHVFPSSKVWVEHFEADILPFWIMDEALGTPKGNFPTFRDMNGNPTDKTNRYVRTISRQVYVYLIGFSLTGNETLLDYAKSGISWIEKHALDHGKGFYTVLDVNGSPVSDSKSAQDLAYISSAYSADYFITRNENSKNRLNEIIRLIFDGPYWDEENGKIIDQLDNDLIREIEFENEGTDIVTILDQINAYLLLFTNQTSSDEEHRLLLYKLRHLGDLLVNNYYEHSIFWNTDVNRTDYSAKHVDTGHTFKTYWMLHRINQLWLEEFKYPIFKSVLSKCKPLLLEANGVDSSDYWGTNFSDYLGVVKNNPDWWVQIELNQLSADLGILDKTLVSLLNDKMNTWLHSNFIDSTRVVRGVREGIKWDGTLYGNDDSWTSKSNEWKNGYHETEQCLILHIASHAISNTPITLYFSLPNETYVKTVKPYFFTGKVKSYKDLGVIDNSENHKFAITFFANSIH